MLVTKFIVKSICIDKICVTNDDIEYCICGEKIEEQYVIKFYASCNENSKIKITYTESDYYGKTFHHTIDFNNYDYKCKYTFEINKDFEFVNID